MSFRARRGIWLASALVAVSGAAVHLGTLRAAFVYDDDQFVAENEYLRSARRLPALLTQNIVAGAGLNSNFYRPVQSLTHWLDVAVGGLTPWRHHLTNVLLFGLLCAAVCRWLGEFVRPPAALAAAALFCLHPLQTQAVAYISGRGDILALLFLCAALLLYDKSLTASLVCAALALLSKESMVVLPALVWLHVQARRNRPVESAAPAQPPDAAPAARRRAWPRQVPFWALAGAYVALRLTLLNFDNTLDFQRDETALSHSFANRVSTYATTLVGGMRLWVWPSDLHHGRTWPVFATFGDWRVVGSLASLAAWVLLAAALWRRRPPVAAGMLWFVVATLPTSNLVALINSRFHDHWFIGPGLGLALASARLMDAVPRRWLLPAALVPAATLGWMSVRLDSTWRDALSLNRHILHYEPDNPSALNNLAVAQCQRGQYDEAAQLLRRSLAVNERQAQAHYNLGGIFDVQGRLPEARREYMRAVELDDAYFHAHFALGELEIREGRPAEARARFEKTLAINPLVSSAYLWLAEIEAQTGRFDAARAVLRRGFDLTRDPRLKEALDATP